MSEVMKDPAERKATLKRLILRLHQGEAPDEVRKELVSVLYKIPPAEIAEVEQELMAEGLPEEEIVQLCDVHALVLEGHIDHPDARQISPGHPVSIFIRENQQLLEVIESVHYLYTQYTNLPPLDLPQYQNQLHTQLNLLMDIDKHYRKKEQLLFPYLEKHGITGPPKVMWAKHDEIREMLKSALETIRTTKPMDAPILQRFVNKRLRPMTQAIAEMINKEGEILFPLALDTLTAAEWYKLYQQIPEIGFCLYDPQQTWIPEGVEQAEIQTDTGRIHLPSGSLTMHELTVMLNSLPIDITFVGKDDKVKYFSQSRHRIFDRNRAILQRDVRLCHPPSSVAIVEQILSDFKSGKASRAPFWIQSGGEFIHIEYFALRDEHDDYLGTLEVSQILTEKRQLEGEQRLLSYQEDEPDEDV
ncbi:DUF438 domain-containing protein [candidate division KSB3 bacterium]|uniref:DUF438 domain-containing protein n=1 Tax=candidate division KSB3 bacterium TaxID=2044937 RepID=A0A9D5JY98_9BACT|nr:DUF438 domain-containing protein [candidate division KSB3 bacterium]MBD3326335.1 DUF438 domain-containing protein [candidate division KSB3 bacterium]